jgi:hypothetical protein
MACADVQCGTVSQTLCLGGPPKIIIYTPPPPVKIKIYICKEKMVSAQRLLQYFQLPDKNFQDTWRYIYNCLRYFTVVAYVFHCFSWNP